MLFPGCNSDYDIDELYTITANSDYTYDYIVKDKNGNILISDEGISRQPKVNVINENLLNVSVQTGTGVSTRWTIYCDVNNGEVSETYYSVIGEYAENVIFVKYNNGIHSVVIQDIFDKDEHFKEIILEDASNVADPVINFVKLDDKIKIVYLKGDNLLESELIIPLE